MANNGRGENERKNNFSGSLNNNNTNEQGVAMGRNAHPTIEENVSGSLSKQRHPNKSATPIYSEIASPVTQARNDDKDSLNDNHNTPTMPNGVAVGRNAHPTIEENVSG
ncbi:MAG: hypothetical protein IKG79_03940, partial [Neisseriaceae bacterium]|nr:hypothetical protein [Neisseriaceae bacterium]